MSRLIFVMVLINFSCGISDSEGEKNNIKVEEKSKAEIVINSTIKAHGGKAYEKAHFSFYFRGSYYRFNNNYKSYEYEYKGIDKRGDSIHILKSNDLISVWKNKVKIDLDEKMKLTNSDQLNSVIYFATLPHKLGDQSVNKFYEDKILIKGREYDVIKVTFSQEGGGTDYDDQFFYWINLKTKLIDFLAYNYQANGGGVRFRVAYNSRKVGKIIFQDYINYKAEVGTSLAILPHLYEQDSLVELSRIMTENIVKIE